MLSELADYYHRLLTERPTEMAPYGWCIRKVSYVAHITADGHLLSVIPLSDNSVMEKLVPNQVKRAVNIAANFLCDNSSYVFGVDKKGKPERSVKCFEASKELYHTVLEGIENPCARALLAFFDTWNPREALSHSAITPVVDDLLAGVNIVFEAEIERVTLDPLMDEDIRSAWEHAYAGERSENEYMRCLVSGELAPVARLHPAIKGVYGAQSSGASLVSFNARAFESYGHDKEQGRNAPVSEVSAHAYATALNYLLADRLHHTRLGDTTIVYWSDKNDEQNCTFMSLCMGAWTPDTETKEDADTIVDATFKAIGRGEYRDTQSIDLDAEFFVLGIAPSAARLSVKYFLRNSFGAMLRNISSHYMRSDIARAAYERPYLTPYQLLWEVEQPNAKKPVVTPILNGPLLRAILEDAPYPQALYDQCILRIHATQEDPDNHIRKVTRGRAAIIRAYLIRNHAARGYDEKGLTVTLNEGRHEVAYGLGRAFAILERIQEGANERVTITNRYFNAASTTPGAVYPLLLRLSVAHLGKMRRGGKIGLANYLEAMLRDAIDNDTVAMFPVRLSNLQQGDFMLGYYHQRQKLFERKSEQATNTDGEEE